MMGGAAHSRHTTHVRSIPLWRPPESASLPEAGLSQSLWLPLSAAYLGTCPLAAAGTGEGAYHLGSAGPGNTEVRQVHAELRSAALGPSPPLTPWTQTRPFAGLPLPLLAGHPSSLSSSTEGRREKSLTRALPKGLL